MHGGPYDDTPANEHRRQRADPRSRPAARGPQSTTSGGWSSGRDAERTERLADPWRGASARNWTDHDEQPTEQLPAPLPVSVRSPGGHRNLPAFLRPPAVWFTGIAAGGIILIVAIILLTLPQPTPPTASARHVAVATAMPTPSVTPTSTPQPLPAFALPAFADWRAAYIANDGNVHVTSLDGQSDITGPALNINTADTTNSTLSVANAGTLQKRTSVSVSPNGMYLAYINQAAQLDTAGVAPPIGALVVINLAGQSGGASWTVAQVPLQVSDIAGWSADSSQIAVNTQDPTNGATAIYVVTPNSAKADLVPGSDLGVVLRALGWLDATHLLVMSPDNSNPPPPVATPSPAAALPVPNRDVLDAPFGSAAIGRSSAWQPAHYRASALRPLSSGGIGVLMTQDVLSGALLAIAQVPNAAQVALSPDASQIVVANSCVDGCTSPGVTTEIIDPRTGAIHPLPQSDKTIAPVSGLLWQPGGHAVAATTEQSAQTPVQFSVSLVDTQQDTARQLQQNAIGLAWSPDGSTLAIADATAIETAATSPGTKVWLVVPGTSASVTLAEPVVAFIGFVRTQPAPNGG